VLRRLRAEPVSQSEGPDQTMVETPGFPLMEAAGIEPASAPAAIVSRVEAKTTSRDHVAIVAG
jgi:hypothetical protein